MIRDHKPDDIAFIVSSWLQSFADSDAALLVTPRDSKHTSFCDVCGSYRVSRATRGHDGVRANPGDEYWKGHRRLIESLIESDRTLVYEADDGLIDAFMCHLPGSPPVIHYVYVRLSARGQGRAKALVSTLGAVESIVYTHRSRTLKTSRLPGRGRFHYDPYQLYW
jgi:hypothetical protein